VSSLNSEEEAAGYFVVDEVLEHKYTDGKMELLVSWTALRSVNYGIEFRNGVDYGIEFYIGIGNSVLTAF
jgi:hypothetical protein